MLPKIKEDDWRKLAESLPDEAMAVPAVTRGGKARGPRSGKEGTGGGGDNGSDGGGDDASEASSANDNDGQASMASSGAVEQTEEVC